MKMVGDNWRVFLVYLAVASLFSIISAIIYKPMEPTEEQIQKVGIGFFVQILRIYRFEHEFNKKGSNLGGRHRVRLRAKGRKGSEETESRKPH